LIELHEFSKIELWLFHELDLSDHAVVLEWEDFAAALFSNLLSNLLFNENLDEVLEAGLLNLRKHNFHHLLSDELLMGGLGEASGFNLS